MLWLKMWVLSGLFAPPILLAFTWWGWLRYLRVSGITQWRKSLFLSALCAGTANFVLLSIWILRLPLHYVPEPYVKNLFGNIGICLLLYSFFAANAGQGKWRFLLCTSSFLAFIVWIPIGIL